MKAERVQFRIHRLPYWQLEPGPEVPEAICRTFTFCDFVDAVDYVCTITAISIDSQHFPEVRLNGRDVFVRLGTPGGITELDFDLAETYENAA